MGAELPDSTFCWLVPPSEGVFLMTKEVFRIGEMSALLRC